MINLWTVTIAFRQPGTSLTLLFKTAEPARAAYDALKIPTQAAEDEARGIAPAPFDPVIEVTDDFGNTASVNRGDIMLHWVTDMAADQEGKKDVATMNAHANAQLQTRLMADPALVTMARMSAPVGLGEMPPRRSQQ